MVKVYKWSDILNSVFNRYSMFAGIDEAFQDTVIHFEEEFQQSHYRYTNILVVRSCSPILHKLKPDIESISSYYVDCIDDEIKNSNNEVIVTNLKNVANLIVSKEYILWTKFKKIFKEFNINFIEIKDMYESDIIEYIKKTKFVSVIDETENYVSIKSNSLSKNVSLKTFTYTISEIEKAII